MTRMIRLALAALLVVSTAGAAHAQTLLNVSYDPTRELYQHSTPRSPNTGRRRAERPSRSASRTAAPARRPAP